MATHSSILATPVFWRIPWTEEPGRLQSIVSQRMRHDRVTEHSTHETLSEKNRTAHLGRMEGRDREFGIDMYTFLCLKWITNKVLLYSTWNSAQCYVAAWIGGEFGGEWIHVHACLSPFAVHLKLSQLLLISYTPTQKVQKTKTKKNV